MNEYPCEIATKLEYLRLKNLLEMKMKFNSNESGIQESVRDLD